MLNQKKLNTRLLTLEEIPVTFTVTTGTLQNVKAYKWGRLLLLQFIGAKNNGSVAAGGNQVQVTINGLPKFETAQTITFYSSCGVIAQGGYGANGSGFTTRVIGSTLSAGASLTFNILAAISEE